ncbi:XRE family transcriptional regulator [Pseudomonas sp. Z2-11]
MALSSALGICNAVERSVAAVIRLVRSARGLAKEDFHGQLDPKHVYNLEHAKVSVPLDTLEILAERLDVEPLALLAVAASYDKQHSPEDFVKYLNKEIKKLKYLGVLEGLPTQFADGALKPRLPGQRTPPEKVDAVLRCRALGLTQKQASEILGMAISTVGRIWSTQRSRRSHREKPRPVRSQAKSLLGRPHFSFFRYPP